MSKASQRRQAAQRARMTKEQLRVAKAMKNGPGGFVSDPKAFWLPWEDPRSPGKPTEGEQARGMFEETKPVLERLQALAPPDLRNISGSESRGLPGVCIVAFADSFVPYPMPVSRYETADVNGVMDFLAEQLFEAEPFFSGSLGLVYTFTSVGPGRPQIVAVYTASRETFAAYRFGGGPWAVCKNTALVDTALSLTAETDAASYDALTSRTFALDLIALHDARDLDSMLDLDDDSPGAAGMEPLDASDEALEDAIEDEMAQERYVHAIQLVLEDFRTDSCIPWVDAAYDAAVMMWRQEGEARQEAEQVAAAHLDHVESLRQSHEMHVRTLKAQIESQRVRAAGLAEELALLRKQPGGSTPEANSRGLAQRMGAIFG